MPLMKTTKTESDVRDEIREYLLTLQKEGSVWFFKVLGNAMQKGGVPDFVGCYKGLFFAFELKKPEDSYGIQHRQAGEIRRINRTGGFAYGGIVSVEKVKDIFANEMDAVACQLISIRKSLENI